MTNLVRTARIPLGEADSCSIPGVACKAESSFKLRAKTREAVHPWWDLPYAQTGAEVIREVTTIPSKEVVLAARVLLNQVRQYKRDFLCGKRRIAQLQCLSVMMLRMRLRLGARDTSGHLATSPAKGPLKT